MNDASYRYAIDYFREDGSRLGPVAIEPDWQPAREWACFQGMRRGALAPLTAHPPGAIEPLWDPELGPPHCAGVRVSVPSESTRASTDIPREFFHELAHANASVWIERGELDPGEPYRFRVCAYPARGDDEASDAGARPRFETEEIARALPLDDAPCAARVARSERFGEIDASDVRVFVPRRVIDEACQLAARADTVETGGVLVGRLRRDLADSDLPNLDLPDPEERSERRPEIFLDVAAQIPARHAEANAFEFSFTPDTWAAAAAALELRGNDEMICGWWHSHIQFCRECPAERRRLCRLSRPFFSADDVHLHRTCFPQAYNVALLISDLPDEGPTAALFGWREGRVVQRGFFILDS